MWPYDLKPKQLLRNLLPLPTHVVVWLLLVATTSGRVMLYFQHSATELFSVGYLRSDRVLPRQIGINIQKDRTAPVTAPWRIIKFSDIDYFNSN